MAVVLGLSMWSSVILVAPARSVASQARAEDAYLATLAGQLRAIHLPDGRALWQSSLPSSFKTPLSLSIPRLEQLGYVLAESRHNGDAALVPFSLQSGKLGRPIEVGLPGAVAIAPDGRMAWVANSGNLEGLPGPTGTTVTPVNLRTRQRLRPIPVGGQPGGIALTPDGARLLVTLVDRQSVVPISTTGGRVGAPIPLPTSSPSSVPQRETDPGPIIIDEPEGVAFVGNLQEDLVFPADVTNVINLKTLRAEPPISMGPFADSAQALVATPDGRSVFSMSYLGLLRINVAARRADLAIPNSYLVSAMAIDNHNLYVSQELYSPPNLTDSQPKTPGYALVPINLSSMAPGPAVTTTATLTTAIALHWTGT
ncbi:MAG TPA: hypothetical protein VKY26_06085 [Actinomycetota bacterium]|nr:hypothetical protein [Actinomycetota bacterium]